MSNIIDSIQLSGVTYTLSAQTSGEGKSVEAGRGIDVASGTSAYTVSFNLPISAGTGSNSIVEGDSTTASGDNSHAEGFYTQARGYNSHAEGNYAQARGNDSHAEGYSTIANGNCSHAEGYGTIISSNYSHAEGYNTSVDGSYSHAEGYLTLASGIYSHAEGNNTRAINQSEHASGQYNVSNKANNTFGNSGNTLFSVGNGTSNNARHNAFEIRQNGDIYLSSGGTDIKLQDHLGGGGNPTVELTQAEYDALVSGGTVDPTVFYIITDAVAFDPSTKVDTSAITSSVTSASTDSEIPTAKAVYDAIPQGGGGKAVSGGTNISITTGETADTINCTLPFSYEGDNLKTTVSGNSFVGYFHYGQIFGINNTLQGKNSGTGTIEKNTTIIGYDNQSLRMDNSIVIGSSNNLGNTYGINNNNYVFGFSNTVTPGGTQDNIVNNNFVIGNNNTINKKTNNFIFGYGIKPSNNDEFSLGKYNNSVSGSTTFGDSGNTLFSVGNGTADNARHNAFEIRQNGDIYLSLNGQDVKLQDQLGGSSITVDTALDSGSTNPVENRVIYNKIDEVEQVTAAALNNINDRLSEDEEVTAAALNALNDRIAALEAIIQNMNNQ